MSVCITLALSWLAYVMCACTMHAVSLYTVAPIVLIPFA